MSEGTRVFSAQEEIAALKARIAELERVVGGFKVDPWYGTVHGPCNTPTLRPHPGWPWDRPV